MLFIFTALFAEAKPIIEYYKLKKVPAEKKFQMFTAQDIGIAVIITGTGKLAAASCVSRILSIYGDNSSATSIRDNSATSIKDNPAIIIGNTPVIINLGVCATKTGREAVAAGEVFIASSIEELETGRCFYPDMLIRHGFKEGRLVTVPVMADETFLRKLEIDDRQESGDERCLLVDMEAAGVYQAANYYVGPDRMHFVKIVSDSGCDKKITAGYVTELIYGNIQKLTQYIENVIQVNELNIAADLDKFNYSAKPYRSFQPDELVSILTRDLKCSVTMANNLRQVLRFCQCSGTDYRKFWDGLYEEGKLPCHSKKEGKLYLDEFVQRLFK